MWTLTTPWHELVIRSASIFVFLFVVLRLWGKKHFGQLTPFDFILLLIMSEAVQNALVDDDKSIPGGMITILTMVALNILLNKITFHFRKAEKVIDGTPKVLIRNGVLDRKIFEQQTMTDQELLEAIRQEGVRRVKDVELATIETNGKISVIKKEDPGFLSKIFS